MIDLHCHILPGIDDGPKTLEESLEMCRIAAADGIRTLFATPHVKEAVYENNEKNVKPVYMKLKEAVESEGIGLSIELAADIHISPTFIEFLHHNRAFLIGGRYFLLELSPEAVPPNMEELVFNLQIKGFYPIITHPERNSILQRNARVLARWIRRGALIQVTAMSVTGEFGKVIKKAAHEIVERGLCHIIATDAHSPKWRAPILSHARDVLAEMVGKHEAEKMVSGRPAEIIRGELLSDRP
ncbi:MAG: hypothetical protein JXB42_12440 [Deltaproteobacteria bacterium]|nr:hypothetical protein [Deltaproteobacteria bacterium]